MDKTKLLIQLNICLKLLKSRINSDSVSENKQTRKIRFELSVKMSAFHDLKQAFIIYFQHLMHGSNNESNHTTLNEHDDELIESVISSFDTFIFALILHLSILFKT